ncbi:MAG: class I fructose-bisphosphate aldolase [Candidatus Humimicrobiaceae bacterium]
MSGIDLRIKKLFNGKKNIILSAIDHVIMYGDQQGIEDSRKAIINCLDTDALLLSRFSLKRNWDLFASKNKSMPVIRINWSAAYYYPLDYRKGYTEIAVMVEEAVEAGAELIISSLFLENNDQEMEMRNVKIFSEVVRQKEKLGIPLIGECYVVEHTEITPELLHNKVKRVSRIMAELGADMVKVFYTNNFTEVVKNTPVPVFSIGAEKLKTDLDVLKKAYDTVNSGAKGIVFGRNIFMANNPSKIIAALNDVINSGLKPENVVTKYNLI